MYLQESVTAVIPAYNEAQRIGAILNVLQNVHELSQIVVVDDGSTDNTAAIVHRWRELDPRVLLKCLPENQGKGGAMVAGAETSANDIVTFLDADLVGIKPDHIQALIEPVKSGQCAMSLGLFNNGRRTTDLSHELIPFLSGQRCLRWSLFRAAPDLASTRWGIEVALSLYASRRAYPIRTVLWNGVTHAMRVEKGSFLAGCWSYWQMWSDIASYVLKRLSNLGRSKKETRVYIQRMVL
ncbi:MAG: glycosyltransferase family 2 protein [Chloroflexi bacterium]|nr:glycosyltransferase family 2 protein [Chloroflexota bacterium]MCI0574894.1 glycosyltransferase family 2 protein [Chloroflexota bacterium]MCI0648396.1 glycosyltransferase family 2 protein [Chloroflexota bacterium]MCI0727517.1 glycosyltransferase family 2 protein [Chloroflexota bacterium]